MKTCPFCAEQIQDAAIACRFCGRDLTVPPAAPEHRPYVATPEQAHRNNLIAVVVVVGIGLMALASFVLVTLFDTGQLRSPMDVAPSTAGAASSTTTSEVLELLSARSHHPTGSHVRVSGEVRNISSDRLVSVVAAVTWRTSGGELVATHDAVIDYSPLMPGQASPFETIGRYNPEMVKYEVAFRTPGGRRILARDGR